MRLLAGVDGLEILRKSPHLCVQLASARGLHQHALRCVIKDSNPDYEAIEITYQAADQAERALVPMPEFDLKTVLTNSCGRLFRLRGRAIALAGPIQLTL